MRSPAAIWRPQPLVLAIVATIGAAGARVLPAAPRRSTALQSQNQVIVRQLREQTAADIAGELRRTLDGPIFDTLAAVNHPDLRAGRLDLVPQHFARGLEAYPHVERFFAWTLAATERQRRRATCCSTAAAASSRATPTLGQAVLDLARRHAPAAADLRGRRGRRRRTRVRSSCALFWTDARGVEYFAVLGFVIDPASMPARLFAGARRRARLRRAAGTARRRRAAAAARHRRARARSCTATCRAELSRRAARLPDAVLSRRRHPLAPGRRRVRRGRGRSKWACPPFAGAIAGVGQRYWPTVLSVLLMLVALGLTVQAHRRSAELARMQTDFVAHVSHQLKTPLSLLSAATETLQMDRIRSPEKLAEYLDTIRAEAARLSALVQRVLEFSRVQQQRSYEFEQVDLGALVRETVDAFAHGLASRRSRSTCA